MAKRVFCLMLDGADENTVGALLQRGGLPQIGRLIRGSGPLRMTSNYIPITPGVFSTILTGLNPGRTGVLTFELPGAGYGTRLATSAEIAPWTLHRHLAAENRRMISVAVPMTSPPQFAGSSISIAGWDSAPLEQVSNNLTWSQRATEIGYRIADEFHTDGAAIREAIDRRITLTREILEREPWDCCALYFGFIDTLGHRLGFGNPLTLELLEYLDLQLSVLLGPIGDAETIVCSDHGFGLYPRAFSAMQWLEEEGLLRLRKRVFRSSATGGVPGLDAFDLQDGAIEWESTTAFCFEATGNAGGIRINVQGQYPSGTVKQRDRARVAGEIIERLRAYRGPDGERVVAHAAPREDVFWGDRVASLPDILFQTHRNYLVFVGKRSAVDEGFELAEGAVHEGPFGGHLPEAFWGSSFAIETAVPSVTDIAPTIDAILGIPAADLDGENRSPYPSVRTAVEPRVAETSPAYTVEEEEIVRRRLEDLGYL